MMSDARYIWCSTPELALQVAHALISQGYQHGDASRAASNDSFFSYVKRYWVSPGMIISYGEAPGIRWFKGRDGVEPYQSMSADEFIRQISYNDN